MQRYQQQYAPQVHKKEKKNREKKLFRNTIYLFTQLIFLVTLFLLLNKMFHTKDFSKPLLEQIEHVLAAEVKVTSTANVSANPSELVVDTNNYSSDSNVDSNNDYSIDCSEQIVEAPVNYSIEEAYQILMERGETDDRYLQICENVDYYPQKLIINLANNPEMLSFVADYNGIVNDITMTQMPDEEVNAICPLFLQFDDRWGYQTYGDSSMIAISGCGPTALSMVVVGLTHNADITPSIVADYAMREGYYMSGTGTSWDLMTDGAAAFGVDGISIPYDEYSIKDALRQGAFVICSMRPGDFTNVGHFIVIYGEDENGFHINDPFCKYRSSLTWDEERVCSQIKAAWAMYRQ